MRSIATAALLALASCSRGPTPTTSTPDTTVRSQTFRGYYVSGFERSEFRPLGNIEERWWLSGPIDCPFLDFNQERYKPWRQTYLEVQGDLSPPGQYGHLGAYKRELTITKTIGCRPPHEGEGVEP